MEGTNPDDLLRSLANANANEARGLETLVNRPEEDLYALLASRLSQPLLPSGSPDDAFRGAVRDDDLLRSSSAITFGKRVFARWSRALHQFLCHPGGEDRQLRTQLLSAIVTKDGGSVAFIAGALVASFGLSPAIAAIIAALVIKLIIAPAADEVCKVWGENL